MSGPIIELNKAPMQGIWILLLLILGACVGSFLNVVVYRLPRGQSIVFPPSHCPACGRSIRWYDNIPIISYLLLWGRCRFCKGTISPQYVIVEVSTALLVAGLYVCYYVLRIRDGAGQFGQSWGMFASHAALLCGLLACSIIDAKHWIVPLEVCWFVSLVGLVCSGADPHPFIPTISPVTGAMSLAAVVGIAIAMVGKHFGLIRESFIDATDKPAAEPDRAADEAKTKPKPTAVAFTSAHGVNPRKEILLELLFLLPAIVLAAAAPLVLVKLQTAREIWTGLLDPQISGRFAVHFGGLLAALLGYLIGGLWIWGIRILGTLVFGKEAMGMGDVHILAGVGAVTGWVVPSMAFFIAPMFGLLWAVYLWLRRGQRELPYGPWLAAATLVVMLFYDAFAGFIRPLAQTLQIMIE